MRQDAKLYKLIRFLAQIAIGIGVLVIGILVLGALILVRQVDPEEATRLAERELRGSVLRYGEKPQRVARVYRRKATNYFGKASGLLVATRERLLFVGIEPKDRLSDPDAPAGILTAEFPNDTLLELSRRRVYFLLASGVVARRTSGASNRVGETLASNTRNTIVETYAAQSGYEDQLDSLVDYVNAANTRQRQEAAAERILRQQVAEILRRPLYYEIKRGDALFNIASRFGATPEQIQSWNNMSTTRVRIRDTLLVKPAGK